MSNNDRKLRKKRARAAADASPQPEETSAPMDTVVVDGSPAASRTPSATPSDTPVGAMCVQCRRVRRSDDPQRRPATIDALLRNNAQWAADVLLANPKFFSSLAQQQKPEFLWIGCSDSRVPANQIVGLPPGEIFVHRNIANVVVTSDLNLLSVLQFAVDCLKVRHVIVCGHYGCGGVNAALNNMRLGLCDQWIRHVRDVHDKHAGLLRRLTDIVPAGADSHEADNARLDLLCELNVVEQVRHVAQTTVIRDAWHHGNAVQLHGWAYGLKNGQVQPLLSVTRRADSVDAACDKAATSLFERQVAAVSAP